jgi:hypothetical protein
MRRTQSSDTTPSAEAIQLAILRRASPARRAWLAQSLTRSVIQLSRQGIRQRNPAATNHDVLLGSIAANYGAPCMEQLRAALEQRQAITMLDPLLQAALVPLVDVLDALGAGYYIGGSVASSLHGIPRSTLDADLIADLKHEHVPELVARLQDAYYVDEGAIEEALASDAAFASFNVIHFATALKIDVFILQSTPFDQEEFRRAAASPLAEDEPSRSFNIASAEDMVLRKLQWYVLGGQISDRQWGDILGILKLRQQDLDYDYLRRWATQLELAALLERACAEAGIGE